MGNRLTGEIPAELGNLSNLRILSLYANDLTGNIPSELGKLTNLEQLLLDDNDFTGQLPSELANITGLERLFVRESRLTGEIPAWLASLDELEYLYLEGNDFTGCISPWFERDHPIRAGRWPMHGLATLALHLDWYSSAWTWVMRRAGPHRRQDDDAGRLRAGWRRLHRRTDALRAGGTARILGFTAKAPSTWAPSYAAGGR